MLSNISILLATYNGDMYLPEQIESILNQSHKHWQLIVRDDGSDDNTCAIIEQYIRKYPDKIQLISDSKKKIGPSQNFLCLLNNADTDYVMFCDQDDVWLPNKIEITLDKMREIEKVSGQNTPTLVHTDLKVVDKNLKIISESFWKFQHLDPQKGKNLNRLLIQNAITGCTIMINKSLRDKIELLPEQTIMYDWWISLVAAACGKIDYVPIATSLYRQHNNNTLGAKEWNWDYVMNISRLNRSNFRNILRKTQLQAKAFLDIFKDELAEKDYHLLKVYATLEQHGFFARRFNLIKYGFFKIGFLRNVGLFWSV